MKKVLTLFWLIAYFCVDAQPVAKNVVVEHFTNTYCSVCFSRNPGFYNNLWQFPGVLHIAYYPSKPYPACPLNQHNKQENDDRTNFYGVYGATPRIVIQGVVIDAAADYNDGALFQNHIGQTTSFDVSTRLSYINSTSVEVRTIVRKVDASSLSNLQLYAAIVEDTLFFNANNGETTHYNVFRKSVFGAPMTIAVPANIGDSVVYTQQVSLNSVWDKNRVYVLSMLQDGDNNIVQAAKSNHLPFVASINTALPDCPRVFPNPVTDRLFVDGLQGVVMYAISDVTGKVLRTQQTENKFVDVADLPPGLYLLKITTGSTTKTARFIRQ